MKQSRIWRFFQTFERFETFELVNPFKSIKISRDLWDLTIRYVQNGKFTRNIESCLDAYVYIYAYTIKMTMIYIIFDIYITVNIAVNNRFDVYVVV